MNPSSQQGLKLSLAVEELSEILGRLIQLHEELLDLLVEKEAALVEVRIDDLESFRKREEKLLRRVIEEEKERLLVTEEVGDLLGHERPVTITSKEILDGIPTSFGTVLKRHRDGLRTVALRLARQNAVNRALIEHSVGHIHVFLSRLASEELGVVRYDQGGSTAGGSSGPLLMDRRG